MSCVSSNGRLTWTLLLFVAGMLVPTIASAQRGVGELHVHVADETGAPVVASGVIASDATRVRRTFVTSGTGLAVLPALPTGVYELSITRDGFAPHTLTVDIQSSLPVDATVTLRVAPVVDAISVTGAGETLLDPRRTGSVRYIGLEELRERPTGSPGRSVIDLVNAQPGWLLEANGVLHARGSEYQVQYVIDGIPLRDNRSPAFAQSLGADEFESIAVRTAGYPAEFGGKLGGVIEVNTAHDVRTGVHGSAVVQAGSFGSISAFGSLQFGGQRLRGGFSAETMTTDRYLDPPTERNFTNHGGANGLSGRLQRAWSESNRTRVYAYRRTARFDVPNEVVQEVEGQRQERTAREHLGQVGHQQVLSSKNVLLNLGVMARETAATLASNDRSIPIRAAQDRGFTELYANGSVTAHRGIHEIKVGGEAIGTSIREQFDSTITARQVGGIGVFDSALPSVFNFAARRRGSEQALYAQDRVRIGAATVSAGLRYDRYRLMVNEQALSPRVSASWLVERPRLVLHASYDRTFESQPIENILLASSDVIDALGGEGETRPLRPSRGHFAEFGLSASLGARARIDGNYYLRRATNATDDEVLLNTAVSFPIAFAHATVKGVEIAFDVVRLGPISGSVAYSLAHGVGRLPVAGGLFIGGDVSGLLESHEQFDLSQDQRHTVRGRVRTGIGRRGWLTGVMRFDSGLPVELDDETDEDVVTTQYGAAIAARVDFERERVTPSLALDLSGGVRLLGSGAGGLRLQADVFNVLDRLNVINVAGLLSGTAIAPRRSFAIRVQAEF
jgi:hypothetical protein